ncbi:hypothetical protein CNECB9_2540039 [Cupriavidus necator]|uniref:Uncharacterized protein n=1 Tax=Cupriavidus necator TaxID=106590 RepID=A0A1K0IF24_CUPNE|nr:hypothetical protein CNECB9_2540039 [Cupriavidus necator]
MTPKLKARTGKPVNIKKGQFLAPWSMQHVVAKARAASDVRRLMAGADAPHSAANLRH